MVGITSMDRRASPEGFFGVCDLRAIYIHGECCNAGSADSHRSNDRRNFYANALSDSKERFFRRDGYRRCGHGTQVGWIAVLLRASS